VLQKRGRRNKLSAGFEKFNLSGKTAFVTGGGTGLGYFMSRGLVRAGANVCRRTRRVFIGSRICGYEERKQLLF
jgi:hypothetical protein